MTGVFVHCLGQLLGREVAVLGSHLRQLTGICYPLDAGLASQPCRYLVTESRYLLETAVIQLPPAFFFLGLQLLSSLSAQDPGSHVSELTRMSFQATAVFPVRSVLLPPELLAVCELMHQGAGDLVQGLLDSGFWRELQILTQAFELLSYGLSGVPGVLQGFLGHTFGQGSG